jgi:AraC family transcriptional regulator of adaptative response/methylated-DNA-[protein]-cysteine methyltransferase
MKMIDKAALSESEMERAWKARDAGYDGLFFLGVKTTGIFCRPSCPSKPRREHVEFFPGIGQAVSAGYRPCKRCQPELADGKPPGWILNLMKRASAGPETKLRAADLRALGVTPERARRWFKQHYGLTFAAWCRGLRLSNAFTQIRRGEPLDDVILGNGFESHSGFRDAFSRTFGKPPGHARNGECLRAAILETPLGPMLAVAGEEGLCQLDFADRRGLERLHHEMRRRFGLPIVPGDNATLRKLREELRAWFDGRLRQFTVPIAPRGTEFQKRVWKELIRIPYGKTVSYADIAKKVGSPKSVRAVARANGSNRLSILIPCHRVIASNGELCGYGGGVWRKRLLLELEHTGKLPGRNQSTGR